MTARRFSIRTAPPLAVLASVALLWAASPHAATSEAAQKQKVPAAATPVAAAASQPKVSPYAKVNRSRQQAAAAASTPQVAPPVHPGQQPPSKMGPRSHKKT